MSRSPAGQAGEHEVGRPVDGSSPTGTATSPFTTPNTRVRTVTGTRTLPSPRPLGGATAIAVAVAVARAFVVGLLERRRASNGALGQPRAGGTSRRSRPLPRAGELLRHPLGPRFAARPTAAHQRTRQPRRRPERAAPGGSGAGAAQTQTGCHSRAGYCGPGRLPLPLWPVTDLDWIIVAFTPADGLWGYAAGADRRRAVARRVRGGRDRGRADRAARARRGLEVAVRAARRARRRAAARRHPRVRPRVRSASACGGGCGGRLGPLDGARRVRCSLSASASASPGSSARWRSRRPARATCATRSSARRSCASSTPCCRPRARSSTRWRASTRCPAINGPAADVRPPNSAIARDPAGAARRRAAWCKVLGTACGLGVQGSGWIARRRRSW